MKKLLLLFLVSLSILNISCSHLQKPLKTSISEEVEVLPSAIANSPVVKRNPNITPILKRIIYSLGKRQAIENTRFYINHCIKSESQSNLQKLLLADIFTHIKYISGEQVRKYFVDPRQILLTQASKVNEFTTHINDVVSYYNCINNEEAVKQLKKKKAEIIDELNIIKNIYSNTRRY